ncbi:hypothetical protein [Spirosoma flavum]|uniref:Uncharacterized protein n=1 Tax=Spirosoma flavum TaxID=2048557 RepID=A0ABW6AUY4_9BACT
MNPQLWAACQRVNQGFIPPSGILNQEQYRKSDKTAFAKAVQETLKAKEIMVQEIYEWA